MAAAASPAADPPRLEPDRELALAFEPGAGPLTVVYDLGGQNYATIEVDQRGVDVEVLDPGGTCLSEPWSVDLVRSDSGSEYMPVSVGPDTLGEDGTGELRLMPSDPTTEASGELVLRITDARSHPKGAELCQAWRAFLDARVEALDRSHAGQTRSTAHYRRSVELFRRVGDDAELGQALLNQAIAERRLGRYSVALELLSEARRRMTGLQKARDDLCDAYSEAAIVYERLGHYELAGALFEDSLRLAQELNDTSRTSRALNGLGLVYKRLDRWLEALDLYQRALGQDHGDACAESAVHVNLTLALTRLGDFHAALQHATQAAELAEGRGGRACRNRSAALNSLGVLYGHMGRWRIAASTLRQALETAEPTTRQRILNNLGRAYRRLGEPVKARNTYLEAAELAQDLGDEKALFILWGNLGRLALDGFDDPESAREFYASAAGLEHESGGRHEASLLLNGAELDLATGHPAAAVEKSQNVLRLEKDRPQEAAALYSLAAGYLALGRADRALQPAREAVQAIEALRDEAPDLELRASILAEGSIYYELWIQVLLAREEQEPGGGWLERSLEVAERARARTLLEMLDAAAVERTDELDPELARLERQMASLAIQRDRQRGREAREDELERIESSLSDVQARILERRTVLQDARPRRAELTSASTLTAAEMREAVVDGETALLHSFLGSKSGWLWIMSRDELRVVKVSPRGSFDHRIRLLLEALTSSTRSVPGESLEMRRKRVRQAATTSEALSRELSEELLGSLLPLLESSGVRRIVAVADGPLALLPWSALLRPGEAHPQPLVLDFEWAQLPSVSVLASIRRHAQPDGAASRRLAVIADPVFSRSDPRIAEEGSVATARQALDDRVFRRLPETAAEARAIASMAGGNSLVATGFEATTELVTSGVLKPFQMVHFATHGVIETDYPELSALVLSQVDAGGSPLDGLLRLPAIYRLELSADLVVLSACETALGQELRGEGLIGLTRGFLYAGASSVVASLWTVDDRSTRELMERIYRHYLERGLPISEALHAAQREMAADGRAPSAWAAFVLQGDWRR